MTQSIPREGTPLAIGSIRCVVDVETTRRIFSRLATGSAERCVCDYCRNFVEVRDLMFPSLLKTALESVGIDWRKESEVVHYGRPHGTNHLYQVWVNFVGSVQNGDPFEMAPDRGTGPKVQITAYDDAVRYTPKAPEFNGHIVARIEAQAELPWVLPMVDPEIETERQIAEIALRR